MEAFEVVKFIKFLGVVLFAAGAAGTFASGEWKIRQRYAYFLAAPGFLMTWIGGYMMVDHFGHDLFSGWIVGAFICSIISINIVHWTAAKPGRGNNMLALVALGGLVVATALMVWRPF